MPAPVKKKIARWDKEARAVESEARQLRADGCRYLTRPGLLRDGMKLAERSTFATKAHLNAISQAATALVRWFEETEAWEDHHKGDGVSGDDPDTPLSPAKLADRLGIPKNNAKAREALRKRLESWRKANLDGGWIETRDPKPREPRYLYPLGKVWPLIQDLKPSG